MNLLRPVSGHQAGYSHDMKVTKAPEVAPAAPKQAKVDRDGNAFGVFACSSGELPVALNIQSS